MNISTDVRALSPKAAQKRRQELEECFQFLRAEDNGPRDMAPAPDTFDIQQHSLHDTNVSGIRLMGSVLGTVEQGMVILMPQDLRPSKMPAQEWIVDFQPDYILCRYSERSGNSTLGREERLSRTGGESSVGEWKLTY
jgi:hypothetical protein